MKLEIKRDAILVIPENDQDRAFIEDTLGMKTHDAVVTLTRIDTISLGYSKTDEYCLKSKTA